MKSSLVRNAHLPFLAALGFGLGLLSLVFLSGCRTMEGAGKDIERAGEKIQDNAEKHN